MVYQRFASQLRHGKVVLMFVLTTHNNNCVFVMDERKPLFPDDHDAEFLDSSKLPQQEAARRSDDRPSGSLQDLELEGVTPMDILCGRTKRSWNHNGNRLFKNTITAAFGEYQAAKTRASRTDVVNKVVDVIRQRGGRFLNKDEETNRWKELSINKTREKVWHALRDRLDGATGKRKHRERKRWPEKERGGRTSAPPSLPSTTMQRPFLPARDFFSEGSSIESSAHTFSEQDWVEDTTDNEMDFLDHINEVLGPALQDDEIATTAFTFDTLASATASFVPFVTEVNRQEATLLANVENVLGTLSSLVPSFFTVMDPLTTADSSSPDDLGLAFEPRPIADNIQVAPLAELPSNRSADPAVLETLIEDARSDDSLDDWY